MIDLFSNIYETAEAIVVPSPCRFFASLYFLFCLFFCHFLALPSSLTFFLSLSLHYSLSPLHFLFLSLTSCLCPFISANLFSFMPERHLTAEWKGLWQQSMRNARALQGNFFPDIISVAAMRDRKSTRLNSSHQCLSRMPSSA